MLRSAVLTALCVLLSVTGSATAQLRAGAAVTDITPEQLPVLVNGSMRSRTVGNVSTRIHARSLALAVGDDRVVIVVADSCMMPRPLLDEAKDLASRQTGIPSDHILISATHAHSAPSCMGALGTDADDNYVPFLREKLATAVAAAVADLKPAVVGFGQANAAQYTALRRWIKRPDRITADPFGNPTVRATMHAGRNLDDVTGESGPEDPDLSMIAIRTPDGRPIAALANFSMHYFGDRDISHDYFGRFCESLKNQVAPGTDFVAIMSHGCSGDIWRRDYAQPDSWDPQLTIDQYANALAQIAARIFEETECRPTTELGMLERRMSLKYRVPNKQLLEWAQRTVEEMGDRLPETQPEIYAREQIMLYERQGTEIVVQALRLGDIGIATTPNETYAITGLKIKAASPLRHTMVIELANGGDGYIPPPEQHLFGGYNTWAARSAGLEVMAEPKITETAIGLLESVTAQPRKPFRLSRGAGSEAIAALRPAAWYRLNEFAGPRAVDATGRQRDAFYEPWVTYYLEGPRSDWFCGDEQTNRAPMFVGGRIQGRLSSIGDRYSVAMWIWNGLPTDARDVTGWFFSRDRNHGLTAFGDHVGLGGGQHAGKLVFQSTADPAARVVGTSVIPRWQWRHVTLVRDGASVVVYLNGKREIETTAPVSSPPGFDEFFLGGRSDNQHNWEGRIDEVAIFDRPLTDAEVAKLIP